MRHKDETVCKEPYSVHCYRRDRDIWHVVTDDTGNVVLVIYPEPGVLTQLRAQWLADQLNQVEKDRT